MKPELKPLRDDLYVEIMEAPKSSILVEPDIEWNPKMPVRGKVLAAGKGRYDKKGRFHPQAVKVGQIVQFHFGATDYALDRKHVIVDGQHVQLVIE